jgi:hypothetical protein
MSLLFAPAYSLTRYLQLQSFLSELWPSPHSGGTFHRIATVTSFTLSKVAGQVQLLLPSLQACLLTFHLKNCPSPTLWGSRRKDLCATCLFLFSCLFIVVCFFLFFTPGWGSVCLGSYADLGQVCLWEYHMLLSSPGGLCLPNQSGSWHLAARTPPCFSI